MTTNELYSAIINGDTISDEMKAKASELLATANKAKAKESASKSAENAPLLGKVLDYLAIVGHDKSPAKAIADAIGVNTSKAAYLLRLLVADGKVTAVKPSKSASQVYSLIKE